MLSVDIGTLILKIFIYLFTINIRIFSFYRYLESYLLVFEFRSTTILQEEIIFNFTLKRQSHFTTKINY